MFKHELKMENYLKCVTNRQSRMNIARLRVSSHKLRIQTGRQEKIDIDKRICLHCTVDAIDCELHFLTECNFHNNERSELINNSSPYLSIDLNTISNHDLFIALMSSDHIKVLNSLGSFIKIAFDRRKASTGS